MARLTTPREGSEAASAQAHYMPEEGQRDPGLGLLYFFRGAEGNSAPDLPWRPGWAAFPSW